MYILYETRYTLGQTLLHILSEIRYTLGQTLLHILSETRYTLGQTLIYGILYLKQGTYSATLENK